MIMSHVQKKCRPREQQQNHRRLGRSELEDDCLDQQSWMLLKDLVGCKRAISKTFESSTAPKQWEQKANCSGLRSEWEVRKRCQQA